MSAPVQEILAALTPVLVGANTARYAGIAAVMVFSYDHALTFGDEVRFLASETASVSHRLCRLICVRQVRFFWSGEWTISRILFLLVSILLSLKSKLDLLAVLFRIDTFRSWLWREYFLICWAFWDPG